MKAKEYLVSLGWTCKGRGWTTSKTDTLAINGRTWSGFELQMASLLATRDSEALHMIWVDGECVQQDYTLWSQMVDESLPASKLRFDPATASDAELVHILKGSKVTWWNKLGGFEMTGVVDPEKIRIEHVYSGNKEDPLQRMITFIDLTGGGFRSFRLSNLLKVG